jgi:hypothetical protein
MRKHCHIKCTTNLILQFLLVLTWCNIIEKIQCFEISFDPILRLDKNMNDARITGLSADIARGLDMIGWHYFLESTNEEIAW